MSIQVDVRISFPCTDIEWKTLCRLRTLTGDVHQGPSPISGDRVLLADKLTDQENELLEAMSQKTHEIGTTPLMDALEFQDTAVKAGRSRSGWQQKDPNSIASLMVRCLSEKNGKATFDELIAYVAAARSDFKRYQIVAGLHSCRVKRGVTKDDTGMWVHPVLGEVHV